MKHVLVCLLVLIAAPALAQPYDDFPTDRLYEAESLNERELRRTEITLTVSRERREYYAYGSTGCNRWTAPVTITSRRLEVGRVSVTRRACEGWQMRIEADFIELLESSPRWYREGRRLILTGRAGSAVFVRVRER